MDSNLKRSLILDHYQNPRNRGLIDDSTYLKINMDSESCIDEIDIMLKINDDKIVDVKFDGEACAICTSSASIMTELLKGKSILEADTIIKNYFNMINEKDYDREILEEAVVYDDIYKQPNRKKCALLPWMGVDNLIKNERK